MEKVIGVYAAKNKNQDVRAGSRSGGVFTALSDYILNEEGSVYGCVLSKDFLAFHVKATNKIERDEMRGSKYIQSNLGDVFSEVKKDVLSGKYVLFSGTSCQIAGLRKFIGEEYDNLFCVDIVCHGVPSPKVWKTFLEWQEKKYNKKIVEVDFRNKRDFGWADHVETLYTQDGIGINSTVFKTLFLRDNVLRPSCYECRYKSVVHPGDITIADYWGIDKAAPGFNDNKGVSLVLINTEKGNKLFQNTISDLDIVQTKIEDSLQPALLKPFSKPKERDTFWKDFKEQQFEYIAKKYGGYETGVKKLIHRTLSKTKRILIRIKK